MKTLDSALLVKIKAKYASEPNKLKILLVPWLEGALKVLDNTMATLTPNIIADTNHQYNTFNQWSPNIKSTASEVRARTSRILSNIDVYDANKVMKLLRTIRSIIAANPQYKTNPFFQLKVNTQYSFEQCVASMEKICKSNIVPVAKTKTPSV